MTRNNVKFVGNGITAYIATIHVKKNFTNGIKLLNVPTQADSPEDTIVINLNKVERRWTIRGYLNDGKLNSSETYGFALQKRKALETMFGLREVIPMTWEGETFNVAVDKYEIAYKAKDGKEVANGTTTGATASKLVDSSKTFTNAVVAGYLVHNTTSNTFALVTAVDSATTLSLDTNIITSGQEYTIYPLRDGEAIYDVVISCVFGADAI